MEKIENKKFDDENVEKHIKSGYFESDYKDWLHRGKNLDKYEILSLAKKNVDELDLSDWKVQESNEISLNNFVMTHATDHFPVKENNQLNILPSAIADPEHTNFYFHRGDEEKKIRGQGVSNYRFTVHFGVLGYQPSHWGTTSDGLIDYESLEKRKFVIFAPASKLLENENNSVVSSFNVTDTYFFGKVKIPFGSIVVVEKSMIDRLRLTDLDMNHYQILITDDVAGVVRKLNTKKKKSDLWGSYGSKIKFNSGNIELSCYKCEHDESIFKKIESRFEIFTFINRIKYGIPDCISENQKKNYLLLRKFDDLKRSFFYLRKVIKQISIDKNINNRVEGEDNQKRLIDKIKEILIPVLRKDIFKIIPLVGEWKNLKIDEVIPTDIFDVSSNRAKLSREFHMSLYEFIDYPEREVVEDVIPEMKTINKYVDEFIKNNKIDKQFEIQKNNILKKRENYISYLKKNKETSEK